MEKARYLQTLARALEKLRNQVREANHSERTPGADLHDACEAKVEIYSFCLMSNHAHMAGLVSPTMKSITPLSRLFQTTHSVFGRWYNRLKNRSGKVAEERFKTRLVQNNDALQVVMAYGDANPVKAGMVKHPKDYPWSTYRFYAYGTKVPGQDLLTAPGWYVALGRSPGERQKRYRQIVDAYLRHSGLLNDQDHPKGHFIGDAAFIRRRQSALNALLRNAIGGTAIRPP